MIKWLGALKAKASEIWCGPPLLPLVETTDNTPPNLEEVLAKIEETTSITTRFVSGFLAASEISQSRFQQMGPEDREAFFCIHFELLSVGAQTVPVIGA